MKLLIGLFSLFSLFFDLTKIDGEVLMVVILNRHGARTPLHDFPETENYFPGYEKGVLTYNGWRQQILLGKYIRNKYLTNTHNIRKEPYLRIKNPSKEFLLISSPYHRTVESSIAYSLGLFPHHHYNIINPGESYEDNKGMPPINNVNPDMILGDSQGFNIMVADKSRDILFHGKKCKIKKVKSEENADEKLIENEEREKIHKFLKENFPTTMKNITIDNLSNTLIKYLNSAIICLNFNFDKQIYKIPKEIENIFGKFIANYYYFKKFKDDNVSKIISSQFFDETVKMFDYKLYDKNEERKLNFLNNTNVNYSDLKLAVFSGHDTNILAAIKNIIHEEILADLLVNVNENIEFLIPKFSSSLEFHLLKKNSKQFVRVYYNGLNITNRIANGKNIKEIEYGIFRDLLISKIYPEYDKCVYKATNTDED